MKKSFIFFYFLFLCFIIVFGQDDKLKKIRQLYADTNDKIAKSKLPNGEGWGYLYSNEINVNSNNGSWRAVGNYSNKIIFWYTDQPEFQEDQGKSEYSVLVKIEIQTIASAGKNAEEYLYDDGKLVFYFKTSAYGEEPKQEFRYYFSDGKLFRYQENQDIKVFTQAGVTDILSKSEKLQKLFIQTFN